MSCDVWTTHVHAWMGKTLDSSPKIEEKESQAKMCFHVTFSCQLTCERFRKCAFLLLWKLFVSQYGRLARSQEKTLS